MSVAVIGQGYVGGTLTTVLAERGEKVYAFDKTGECANGGTVEFNGKRPDSLVDFVQLCEGMKRFSGVFFVCVPTPMQQGGAADVSIVEGVLSDLCDAPHFPKRRERLAVVKSTVPPGSVDRWNARFARWGLHIIANPEFLTEANALDDMRNPTRILLGGPRPYINEVRNIYRRLFRDVDVVKTNATTAEMVKYLTNCMLAVKVSFANEIAQICEALEGNGLNIDYDKVVEYAKLDRRLGDSHWSVPGPVATPDGRYVRGFGGHCLPKDINALIRLAEECGVDPKVMRAAWEKTLELRGPEDRDWECPADRAVGGGAAQ